MRLSTFALFASMACFAVASPVARGTCTNKMKIAACKQEIATIRSHAASDAAKIPLAPLASRTFIITPNEATIAQIPVNVGVTANSTRALLVILATVLVADVPEGSDSYIVNSNGSVTSDFIQTNNIVLPYVHVREIHDFNDACEITSILGYVHGEVTAATGSVLSGLGATLL